MKYIEYEVTNTHTGEKTTFQINKKFKNATPDNIVFKIEQEDIKDDMFVGYHAHISPPSRKIYEN